MYLLILTLPFLSFFSICFFGRFIGTFGSCLVSTTSILLCFLLSLYIFFEVCIVGSPCTLTLSSWMESEVLSIQWEFFFDSLTSIMLLVVCTVSSLVHFYSIEYLSGDPHQSRFMAYLSLFTGFMLLLVSAANFVIMFLGWEGIGLSSFLLIGFWNNRIQANKSAIKAMLVNRLGDVGIILGLCGIFLTFKSLDYCVVFSLVPNAIFERFSLFSFDIPVLNFIAFLLFCGVVGKSAQIGLHIWLADAMEGPTPVSALIHAATLVTAGVFLIIRCSCIFENSDILVVISLLGVLTAFFAATAGLVQNDAKKVIAYSTCSQLGYMVFAAGLSQYSVSFFHLANHALFKALLFLSAGCIIHGLADQQDLRKFGGIIRLFPLSYVSTLVGSLALAGFPFLSGFYSKDVILETTLISQTDWAKVIYALACVAACCTSFYSFRLIFMIFLNPANGYKSDFQEAHEAPKVMAMPLFCLCLGAIFFGFFTKDLLIGMGSQTLETAVTNNVVLFNQMDAEFISPFLKNIPFFCSFFGFFFAALVVNVNVLKPEQVFNLKIKPVTKSLYTFLSRKWNFDQIVTELITLPVVNFGYSVSFLLLDKGIIEQFGPSNITRCLQQASYNFSNLQSGFLANYAFFIIATLFLIVFFVLYFFKFFHIFLIFFCYVLFKVLL